MNMSVNQRLSILNYLVITFVSEEKQKHSPSVLIVVFFNQFLCQTICSLCPIRSQINDDQYVGYHSICDD